MATERNDPKRPVHSVRYGAIRAAIWRNALETGDATRPMYNVTLTRSYRDAGGNWQDTQSFGYDDLLVVAKVADQCHTWIAEQLARDTLAARQADATRV